MFDADRFAMTPFTKFASLFVLTDAERAGFPNRLVDRQRPALPQAWRTLVLLMLIALGPRLLVAVRIPTPCVDGTRFIGLAEAWQAGDLAPSIYNFNLYPPILAGLHHCGLSWEAAAKVWGLICSVLTVLPLFGWIRRTFNDRVAVVGCLLYAGHSELVEWSPEMVRDQTFWLLFTTCLYCQWRAATEPGPLSYRHFFLVGWLLPLSAAVRFEGLFLLLPLLAWCRRRAAFSKAEGVRIRRGLIVFALVPATLVALAVLFGGDQFRDRLLYLAPWRRVVVAWRSVFGAADVVTPAAILGEDARLVSSVLTLKFLTVLERGVDGLFALVLAIGFAANLRLFCRSDQRPILFVGLIIAAGIWVHLWFTGGASSRYSLPIVILGVRCAALGVMQLGTWGGLFLARTGYSRIIPLATATWVLLAGWYSAATTDFTGRRVVAELGERIRRDFGDDRIVVGCEEQLPLIGYYADARIVPLTWKAEPALLLEEIVRAEADIVVLPRRGTTPESLAAVRKRQSQLKLAEIDLADDPRLRDELVVLARTALLR
ncbi:MAG: glycosyltransferase family 39 protein [Planctomycetaceae bacterium]|nr:glycosyltransferase family 39 protein [Planctomycetaceae bacterium]